MTKAQGRRSQKLKGYYERQYAKTSANKARRSAKRARRKVKAKQPNAEVSHSRRK